MAAGPAREPRGRHRADAREPGGLAAAGVDAAETPEQHLGEPATNWSTVRWRRSGGDAGRAAPRSQRPAGRARCCCSAARLGRICRCGSRRSRRSRDRFRMVAFDHRGHGRSPVPPGPYTIADLGARRVALMDQLGHRARLVLPGSRSAAWSASGSRSTTRADRPAGADLHRPPISAPPIALARARRPVRAAGTTEVIADAVVERWFTPVWASRTRRSWPRYRAMIVATDRPRATPAAARRSPRWTCATGCRRSPPPRS